MTSRLLRLTGTLLILILSLGARPAHAQGTITLSTLTIELWPEYDKPATLVILKGTLAASVPLPAQLALHIPAASGGPFAVAAADASGKLLNTQYTTTPSGDTIAINLTTDFPAFHIEYYDPALTITGDARDYTFQWTADYAVTVVTVRVQEPVDARDLTAEPAVVPAGTADFGLNYYATSLGALSAGQSVSFHLRYSKSTVRLSSEVVSQNAPVPLATPTVTQPLPPRSNLADSPRGSRRRRPAADRLRRMVIRAQPARDGDGDGAPPAQAASRCLGRRRAALRAAPRGPRPGPVLHPVRPAAAHRRPVLPELWHAGQSVR